MQTGLSPADRKLMAIAGALLAILSVATILATPPLDLEPSAVPSSYLPTPRGTRAAFLLLQRLGMKAQRWEEPPFRLLQQTPEATLILIEPTVTPSRAERRALTSFVKNGGHVLFCGSSLSRFFTVAKGRTSQTLGAGEITWWPSATPLTNAEIERADNLPLFLNSIGSGRTVYWDEYFHGENGSLWGYAGRIPPIRSAAVQLALLAIASLLAFSRRSGPVIAPVRTSRLSPLEFVDTLGTLYRRAKAYPVAIDISLRQLRLQLTQKLGLPLETSDPVLAQAAAERLGWNGPELERTLTSASRPDPASALELVQTLQKFLWNIYQPSRHTSEPSYPKSSSAR